MCSVKAFLPFIPFIAGGGMVALVVIGWLFLPKQAAGQSEAAAGGLACGTFLIWLAYRMDKRNPPARWSNDSSGIALWFRAHAYHREFCRLNAFALPDRLSQQAAAAIEEVADKGSFSGGQPESLRETSARVEEPSREAATESQADSRPATSPEAAARKEALLRMVFRISLPIAMLAGALCLYGAFAALHNMYSLASDKGIVEARVVERSDKGVKYRFRLTEGGAEYFRKQLGREIWAQPGASTGDTIAVQYSRRDPFVNQPAEEPVFTGDSVFGVVFLMVLGMFPIVCGLLMLTFQSKRQGLSKLILGYTGIVLGSLAVGAGLALLHGTVATSLRINGDFVQHRDVANQYSILYPSSWEPMPDNFVNLVKQQLPESRQLLLAVWSKDGKLNMQVTKERTDENGSLNDLYESSLASSPLPHNTVSKDEVTIDGIKAIKTVNTTTTPDGKPAKYLHLFLLHDGCVWTIGIGGAPGSFDTYLTDINKMVDSFSFEKP
jgi:hypothetical protein